MSHDQSLNPETMPNEPEKATLEGKNKFLGFWFFLGGETVLFACLFGTFIALRNSTAGGPTADELFGLELVFIMTMLLLTSSLTSVYAVYHMRNNNFKKCNCGSALRHFWVLGSWHVKYMSLLTILPSMVSHSVHLHLVLRSIHLSASTAAT